jgi:cyclopropane-fatty-acyl-phospholipid synthase
MNAPARAIAWVEAGSAPDAAIRFGIRRLLRQRLLEIGADDAERAAQIHEAFLQSLRRSPVALVPKLANEQHYELPPALFGYALGPHRKYSSCYWPTGVTTLAAAEDAALDATRARARLADGMRVLELGCGWGSLTLDMARRYPASSIVAVTNSVPQRDFVLATAAASGLRNVEVVVADMNEFTAQGRFDRIVSVEMFEHMRNHEELFRRVASWLEADGLFFMHIFTHRSTPYEFVDRDETDWLTRHFFAGGMMPSDDLPLRLQRDLELTTRWRWSGVHYQKTAEAWLANIDRNRAAVLPILAATYGERHAALWLQRWRLFFMACAELFGYAHGQEWGVSHYLFARAGGRV